MKIPRRLATIRQHASRAAGNKGRVVIKRRAANLDMLKSIGIEKGKPFNPDAKTRDILTSAAREARALLEIRYEGMFTPYFDNSQWAIPGDPDYLKASQD